MVACSSKGLKIMNIGDGANQPSSPIAALSSDDDNVDPHLNRIRDAQDESDEEV